MMEVVDWILALIGGTGLVFIVGLFVVIGFWYLYYMTSWDF